MTHHPCNHFSITFDRRVNDIVCTESMKDNELEIDTSSPESIMYEFEVDRGRVTPTNKTTVTQYDPRMSQPIEEITRCNKCHKISQINYVPHDYDPKTSVWYSPWMRQVDYSKYTKYQITDLGIIHPGVTRRKVETEDERRIAKCQLQ